MSVVLRTIALELALDAFPFHSLAMGLVFVLGRFLSFACPCCIAPPGEFLWDQLGIMSWERS